MDRDKLFIHNWIFLSLSKLNNSIINNNDNPLFFYLIILFFKLLSCYSIMSVLTIASQVSATAT